MEDTDLTSAIKQLQVDVANPLQANQTVSMTEFEIAKKNHCDKPETMLKYKSPSK